MTSGTAHAFVTSNHARFSNELQQFVRIPSVSGDPKHADDVKRCGGWLASHLNKIGLQRVRLVPTPRHPVIYAEYIGKAASRTILIYGHYDVQPPGPSTDWKFPAFGGQIRDGFLHA